ncbi:MAG TPA: ABC transporter ATP-binding protein [Candidatus Poseidoniales archaeon]|nr:MAG TPA: ABC transporter ATP-binding protein [Candidatus Poseidoniales archaeon]DAC42025.1 MAG TPA: ABC transporter ATP-binding protein [Candidatus Poseidoniales archaeon]HII26567.1 ABC transporter ATP-binding protein [Candidatus Thalassarchaeaceae archaeon]HII28502.1 ABC transporter ATP-binding protein [Candidatus Thalassarchaeaceae archaeon]|tara:strand:- start:1028 stop:2788 length:1761 start_codon:yes stop_codon:yes gene_type:complete
MSEVRHPLARLLSQLEEHRSVVILASICSILNKVWDLAPPVLIGMAIDVVSARENSFLADMGYEDVHLQLYILTGITVVIWVLESLFQYFYAVLWRNLAQTAQHELRMSAYSHIQDLEMQWFSQQSTGGLMAIMNDDVNQLERFLDQGATDLLQVATTIIVVGGIMFSVAPEVALWAIVPIPVIVAGSFMYQRRIGVRYSKVRSQVADLNALLNNNLQGITTIKSFTAEGREAARVSEASESYREANKEAIRLSASFVPIIRMAILFAFSANMLVGGWMALDGRISLGAYSVIVFITQRLLWPLTRLGETFDLYQRAMASTTRVLDLLDTEVGIVEGDVKLKDVSGELEFRDVEFSYPDREEVLQGLNLLVPAGRTVGLVGSTGSGKTTLIRLLMRFHDPQSGTVSLDGHQVCDLTLNSLRGSISLVSQNTTLFPGSVLENIRYGNPEAPLDSVEEAARIAEATEFIALLPNGWHTDIGEGGHRLSGGQRQRIAIARAVLKDAPVLVLDEATSNVDNETEAALKRSISQISKDRTTLIIAHRLSTVRNADIIAVLHKGEISETGTHESLLEEDGIYSRLWAVQTGE